MIKIYNNDIITGIAFFLALGVPIIGIIYDQSTRQNESTPSISSIKPDYSLLKRARVEMGCTQAKKVYQSLSTESKSRVVIFEGCYHTITYVWVPEIEVFINQESIASTKYKNNL